MKYRVKSSTKIAAIVIAAVSTVAMAGCASTSSSASTSSNAGSGSGGSGAAAASIKLSIPDAAGSSVDLAANHFATEVKSKSAGKITVTVIPNGTSFGGDQTAAVTRIQNGSLDSIILSTSVYEATNEKWNAISLPYLFKDTAQEVQYLNGAPGKQLLNSLSSIDTKGLALMSRTPRVVTNSKRPITAPGDLKGLKIRVPQNPLWIKFFSAVGASPTPMDFSEVFTALQTGAIDGQENPVEVPVASKFYEVQKYLSLTNHMNDAFIFAMSNKKWKSLSSADQKIVQAAATDTAKYKTTNDANLEKSQINELKSHGMKVYNLSASGLKQFRQIARSLYPQFASVVGGKAFLDKTTTFVDSLK